MLIKQYFKLERCPSDQTKNGACWQTVWLALVPQFCSAHVNHIFSKHAGGGKKRKKKEGEGGGELECKDINRLSFRLADVPTTRTKVTTNRGSSLQRERLGSSSDISECLS